MVLEEAGPGLEEVAFDDIHLRKVVEEPVGVEDFDGPLDVFEPAEGGEPAVLEMAGLPVGQAGLIGLRDLGETGERVEADHPALEIVRLEDGGEFGPAEQPAPLV